MNDDVKLTPEQIAARDPSYSFQELLDRESVPVPDALRDSTETYLGSEDLDISRWTSREFFDREVEKVWRKTWQMACRESQVREAGDYFVYDIVNDSILITRSESGELRAYYNSCLHRGRVLKRGAGNSSEFRCPFHGWTWNLDGEFQGAPCQWDFPTSTRTGSACRRCGWRPGAAGYSSIWTRSARTFGSTWGSSRSTWTSGSTSTVTWRPTWKR